jgi:phosphate-selective porin OprO/OprP
VDSTPPATGKVSEPLQGLRDRIGLPLPEEQFQLRLGGYAMLDWTELSQSSALDALAEDVGGGAEVRDVQIALHGVWYKTLAFKVEASVDRGTFELKDNSLTREDIPYIGAMRVGHFKEGFGLEHSSSLRYAPFLENSLMDTITASRGLGISFANSAIEERLNWNLGVFFGTTTVDKIGESKSLSLTGRITGLALYDEDKGRLLHLGLSYSHRSLNAPLDYEARPEVNDAPRYLNTGQFSADALDVLGVEAAYQRQSTLVQAEMTWSGTAGAIREEDVTLNDIADEIANRFPRLVDWLAGRTGWERPADSYLWNIPFDLAARGELNFFGGYVQAAHILTGERREYDARRGVFGPVVPKRPVSLHGGGWGAWEIAARVSHLDLNDDYVNGGRESNFALGLNWYLTREVRMALNGVHADISRDAYAGSMNALVMRLQFDIPPRPVQRPSRRSREGTDFP